MCFVQDFPASALVLAADSPGVVYATVCCYGRRRLLRPAAAATAGGGCYGRRRLLRPAAAATAGGGCGTYRHRKSRAASSSHITSMGLLSYVASFLPEVPWSPWGSVDSFLQGLVGACAVSVLYNLMKVHLYIMCLNDPERQKAAAQLSSSSRLRDLLHLLLLTFIYSLLGPRVGALVVLEFSLRAVSMILSLHKGARSSQLFLLCQFSLGCGVTCSLDYLHEGAPHRTWNLLLAVGLSGLIVWQTRRMCRHVAAMYQLHSSKRYCGVCLSLLASWHDIPAVLWRALRVAFLVSDLAAVAVINRDFLSTAEAVRFWTPLTICYTPAGDLHARGAAPEPHRADGLSDGVCSDGGPPDPDDDSGEMGRYLTHLHLTDRGAVVSDACRGDAGRLQRGGGKTVSLYPERQINLPPLYIDGTLPSPQGVQEALLQVTILKVTRQGRTTTPSSDSS
ncbi:unnamed protein product [Ranitomeya imitator]|uniref:Transmembrane protein 82 n=1 Tax=Ranitomeya imitator TaxID=111125 RepID=A0ABN9LDL5_9NEOB|nr:unnamed protein product [Ranitomeya imitator]